MNESKHLKVLFVDDEPQVLRGIDRMLDVADVDWDTEFLTSGEDALAWLSENSDVNAVVSDMKMPGMDGAELLSEISKSYSHVVRIILSGQANKEAVFRAVKPMHQYLSKPCKPLELKTTIQRASALYDALNSENLKNLVGSLSSLPSVPAIYQQVVDELNSSDVSVEAIGETISADAAMTAKILQIANSAIFGLRNPVSSAARAATFMGIDTIKSLVLSVGIFQQFGDLGQSEAIMDTMMQHGLRVACLAKKIAVHEGLGKDEVDATFTAGVLHDVGKLALMLADPDAFTTTLELAKQKQIRSWDAENQVFGVNHSAVGAHMLSMWGIPQSVVEVVALHHRPTDSNEDNVSPLAAVCMANEIIHRDKSLNSIQATPPFPEYLTTINCVEKLDDWANLECVPQ